MAYSHMIHRAFSMKTIVDIEPALSARLKRKAAHQGRGGGSLVAIAGREALYRAMEGR